MIDGWISGKSLLNLRVDFEKWWCYLPIGIFWYLSEREKGSFGDEDAGYVQIISMRIDNGV